MALFENGYVARRLVNGTSPCAFQSRARLDLTSSFGGSGGVGTITEQTLRSSNCAFLRLGQIVGHRQGDRRWPSRWASPRRLEVEPGDSCRCRWAPGGATRSTWRRRYRSLANDGVRNPPYFVDRVEDRNGKVIYQHQATPRAGRQPADGPAGHPGARRPTCRAAPAHGPGSGPAGGRQDRHQAEASDAWFVGYTP